MIHIISETDKAYVAALLDGEGTIAILTNRGRFILQVCICNNDLKVLSWIESLYGGSIHAEKRRPNRAQSYRIYWTSKKSLPVLWSILPYLRIKGDQAKLAIQFQEILLEQGSVHGKIISEEDREFRKSFYDEMGTLNRG